MPRLTPKQREIRTAQLGSDMATARLQGMNIRAQIDAPRAATGTFPYPHRTCAEWSDDRPARRRKRECVHLADEPPPPVTRADATRGSRKLRDAILAMTAERQAA